MKGAVVRQRLSQVGMTQAELARLLKVSPQTVHKILHTGNMQTGTLERICEVTHLPVTFFYSENSPQPEGNESERCAESKSNIVEYKPANKATVSLPMDNEKVLDDSASKLWETSRLSDKVGRLLRGQHKKFSRLCRYVGMTEQGMHNVFDRNSCKVEVLLKMAEYFNVPVNHFLPEDKRVQEESEKDREIRYLEGQLKAYETTLASLLSGMKGAERPQQFSLHTANK